MNAMGTWNTKSLRMAQSLVGEDVISNEQIDSTGIYTSDKNFEDIIKNAEKKILLDLDKVMNPETYMTAAEKTKKKEAEEAEKLKIARESLKTSKLQLASQEGLRQDLLKNQTTQQRRCQTKRSC